MNVKREGKTEKGRTRRASWSCEAGIRWMVLRTYRSAEMLRLAMKCGSRVGGAIFGFEFLRVCHSWTTLRSSVPSSSASTIFSPAVRVAVVCFDGAVASCSGLRRSPSASRDVCRACSYKSSISFSRSSSRKMGSSVRFQTRMLLSCEAETMKSPARLTAMAHTSP